MKCIQETSLKHAALKAGLRVWFENGRLQTEAIAPPPHAVEDSRADDSDFCLWVTDGSHRADGRPILSVEQMKRAAERYKLGKSRSGKTIFWMIDEVGWVHDGHIGNSWVSVMMKAREPKLLRDWHVEHCLFGLHLITPHLLSTKPYTLNSLPNSPHNSKLSTLNSKLYPPHTTHGPTIALVEKETSAVILSEVFPEYIWMATCTPMNFMLDRLEPLKGCQVKLFPSTDMTMSTYMWWQEMAEEARQKLHLDITVSSVLEDSTSEEQKRRKIDLVDFLFEGHTD